MEKEFLTGYHPKGTAGTTPDGLFVKDACELIFIAAALEAGD